MLIAATAVSKTVTEIILRDPEFTSRMTKVTLGRMVQRDVSSFLFHICSPYNLCAQAQIRKAGIMEHAAGGGKESLHLDSMALPTAFFMEPKASVSLIHSAMSLHFKDDSKGRSWFRNPEITVAKISKQTKPFCAMLSSVFMNSQEWVELVQSHYDNLVDDGEEPPVVTERMMTDYFFNIEGMRTVAFGLVCYRFTSQKLIESNRWKRLSRMHVRKKEMLSENDTKAKR